MRILNFKKNAIVEVIWDDAATTHNWHGADNSCLKTNSGLIQCRTVGYFLKRDHRSIQLSHGISDADNDRKDTQAIPVSSITAIHKMRR